MHELLDEFFHFDAKLVQTLRPLFFQPGRLSLDDWAGKRARFMRPLQLYLAAAFLFFFAAQFVQAQVLMVKVDAKAEVSALKEDDPQGSLLEKKLDAYARSHDAAQTSKDVVTSVSVTLAERADGNLFDRLGVRRRRDRDLPYARSVLKQDEARTGMLDPRV